MLFVSRVVFIIIIALAYQKIAVNEQKALRNLQKRLHQNNGKSIENKLKNLYTFNASKKYQFNGNSTNNNRIFKKNNKKIQEKRINFNKNNNNIIENKKYLKITNTNNEKILENTSELSDEFKNSSQMMETEFMEQILKEREKEGDNEKKRNEGTIRKLLSGEKEIPPSYRDNLSDEITINKTIKNNVTSIETLQSDKENNDYEEYRYDSDKGENDYKDGAVEEENYNTKEEEYNTNIEQQSYINKEEEKQTNKGSKRVVDNRATHLQRDQQRLNDLNRLKKINRKKNTISIAPIIGGFLAALTLFVTLTGLATFIFIRNRRRNETIDSENPEIFGDEIHEWAPDHINATQFTYKGPLKIPFKQPLIMEHELENEKITPIREEDHVAFDDALNEVYEIGSEVEKVIPGENKNVKILSHEVKRKDMKIKAQNKKKESGMKK